MHNVHIAFTFTNFYTANGIVSWEFKWDLTFYIKLFILILLEHKQSSEIVPLISSGLVAIRTAVLKS